MESTKKCKSLIVAGRPGKGKSTFLNYLFDNHDSEFFKSGLSLSSVTKDISSRKANIYNTEYEINVYDIPGLFASDLNFKDWVKILSKITDQKFDEIIWVLSIKDKFDMTDNMMLAAMKTLFINFSINKIIFVFTFCDTLSNRIPNVPEILSKKLSSGMLEVIQINPKKIIYFGKEKTVLYNDNYHDLFIESLGLISNYNMISIRKDLDPALIFKTFLNQFDDENKKNADNHLLKFQKLDQEEEEKSAPVNDFFIKIVTIGDSNAGKTSLAQKYVDNTFNHAHMSTVSINYITKNIFNEGKHISLRIWDTAGQERYRSITLNYYRGADAILLVFDVTNRDSYKNIGNWIKKIEECCHEKIIKILVGNKIDLVSERIVSYKEIREYADELNWDYFEISSKTGEGLDNLFTDLTNNVVKLKDTPNKNMNLIELSHKINNKMIGRGGGGGCC